MRSYPRPGIPEARDEQVERRGPFAPTEEAHYSSEASSAAASPSAGSSPSARLGSLLALGELLALLELLFLGLGLDDLRRDGHGRDHRFLGVIEERHAVLRGNVGQAERVAHLHELTSTSIRSGTSSGSASTLISRVTCESTPPSIEPAASPTSSITTCAWIGWSRRTSWRSMWASRPLTDVRLVVLEDRGMRRLLSREDDVEDRVQPRRPRQRLAQLALADREGMRLLPAPVEDAGDQPLAPEPPRRRRAALVALLDLDLDSLACHGAAV